MVGCWAGSNQPWMSPKMATRIVPSARTPFGQEDGGFLPQDHLLVDGALAQIRTGRDLVHDVEHHLFEDRAQAARTSLAARRLSGHRTERVVGEVQADFLVLKQLLELFDQGV